MLSYTYQFLFFAVFTIVVETVVLFLLARKVFKIDKQTLSTRKIVATGIFASMITLPYVWYVLPTLVYWSYDLQLGIAEVLAVALEAIFYCVFLLPRWKWAILASVVCNAASFFLAVILNKIPAFTHFVAWVIS